jgi:hypothetical protein
MPTPIALTDAQLAKITEAARSLPYDKRSAAWPAAAC